MSKIIQLVQKLYENNGYSPQIWRSILEILLTRGDEVLNFCSIIKSRLNDKDLKIQILTLDLLDFTVDNGNMTLWSQVSSKDFLSSLMNILKNRDIVIDVQLKILFLIEKWGKNFKKYQTQIPNFFSVYKSLKDNDVNFPQNCSSTYEKYLKENNNNKSHHPKNFHSHNYTSNNNNMNNIPSNNYVESINLDLNQSSYEKKYKKLVKKLSELTNIIGISNDMIDRVKYGKINNELIEYIEILKKGNSQLVETIQSDKLKDQILMEISLGVIEDIRRTMERWIDLKKGKKTEPFLSFFIQKMAEEPSYRNNNDNRNSGNQKKNNNVNNNNNNGNVNDLFDIFSNIQPQNNMNNDFGMYPILNNNMNMMNNMNNMNNMGMMNNNNIGNMNSNIIQIII